MNKDTNTLILFAILILFFLSFRKGSLSGTTNNEEVWEILRNPDGSLKDIIIHREVRIGK